MDKTSPRASGDEDKQKQLLDRVTFPEEPSLAVHGNEQQDGIQLVDRAMSHSGSIVKVLRDTPDAAALKAEHQISLIDHSKPQEQPSAANSDSGWDDAERVDSEVQTPGAASSSEPLVRRSTTRTSIQNSVRHRYNKQKYRKYQSDRFHDPNAVPEEVSGPVPLEGQEASPAQRGYLERGRAKAKNLMKRKRTLGLGTDEDSIIDILYENQRGAFMFGVPMFSSSSLLNFDPKPWQSHNFRSSPVDIRNAQVPDPSWEWSWKSWYVDMSRDVDEEGWEYSFSFQKGFSWHGNHPWFTSFVRRRRWLRKRIRKHAMHKTKDKSHELTAEYFTIHPKTAKASPEGSVERSAERAKAHARMEDEDGLEKIEISDVGSLTHVLRKATIDREKIVAVRKFVDEGGDELFYLSDRMSEIMSLFVYQSSRRQLLADLLHRYDATSARKDSLSGHTHTDEEIKKKHDAAAKQAENLLRAVNAADEQVKRLEYWSDIKSMTHHGETLLAIDNKHWDATKWEGLDPSAAGHEQDSFRSKQHKSEPPPELHEHPEHTERPVNKGSGDSDKSGYTTAASSSKARNVDKNTVGSPGSDYDVQPYETAPETPTHEADRKSLKGKGPAAATSLDGVLEEVPEEDHLGDTDSELQREESISEFKDAQEELPADARSSLERKVSENGREGVEVVEPKAIDVDYGQDPVLLTD